MILLLRALTVRRLFSVVVGVVTWLLLGSPSALLLGFVWYLIHDRVVLHVCRLLCDEIQYAILSILAFDRGMIDSAHQLNDALRLLITRNYDFQSLKPILRRMPLWSVYGAGHSYLTLSIDEVIEGDHVPVGVEALLANPVDHRHAHVQRRVPDTNGQPYRVINVSISTNGGDESVMLCPPIRVHAGVFYSRLATSSRMNIDHVRSELQNNPTYAESPLWKEQIATTTFVGLELYNTYQSEVSRPLAVSAGTRACNKLGFRENYFTDHAKAADSALRWGLVISKLYAYFCLVLVVFGVILWAKDMLHPVYVIITTCLSMIALVALPSFLTKTLFVLIVTLSIVVSVMAFEVEVIELSLDALSRPGLLSTGPLDPLTDRLISIGRYIVSLVGIERDLFSDPAGFLLDIYSRAYYTVADTVSSVRHFFSSAFFTVSGRESLALVPSLSASPAVWWWTGIVCMTLVVLIDSLVPRARSFRSVNRSVATSLGVSVSGVCPPHADTRGPGQLPAALKHRVLMRMPAVERDELIRFRHHVDRVVSNINGGLVVDDFRLRLGWLISRNYPMSRKIELVRALLDLERGDESQKLNSFVKTEFYSEYKPPRSINARSDLFKVQTGCVFSLIEAVVKGLGFTIKHLNMQERSQLISELDMPYILEGDFSRYECGFTRAFMQNCECVLYRHLIQDPMLAEYVCESLTGRNYGGNRYCRFSVPATRMSGDMCTSLGNSFSTYCLLSYAVGEQPFRLFVEGDDSILTTMIKPDTECLERLGFRFKFVEHDDVTTAGFCSLYSPVPGTISADPMKLLGKFGWYLGNIQSHRIAKGLLTARAMSYASTYRGLPVIWALCARVLSDTDSGIMRNNYWNRLRCEWMGLEIVQQNRMWLQVRVACTIYEPSDVDREYVQRKYGLSVEDQLMVERIILESETGDLQIPQHFFPESWTRNYFDFLRSDALTC